MNIVSVSFSYSEQSMGHRGLLLMDRYINFSDIIKIDLPVCNSNKPDGEVPPEVDALCEKMDKADILVFSVPEATAHYAAAFKNAMDWIVCASSFHSDLGQDSPFYNKPVYVITFTPCYVDAGNRHFEMTKHLIEKMGGIVYNSFVKKDGWVKCLPDNAEWVQEECKEILSTSMPAVINRKEDWSHWPVTWVKQYNQWNNQWRIK